MKLSVTRDSLHAGMGAVSATIPTKTTLPVLSNILLEASDGKLTLSGTDLDISVSVSIDAEIEAEGSVTVPAKKFAEIARELPAAPVHIKADGVEIGIESGKSRFKLFGLPRVTFFKLKFFFAQAALQFLLCIVYPLFLPLPLFSRLLLGRGARALELFTLS